MSNDSFPQNLSEHLERKLAALHANARLVFVLDPPGRLNLPPELAIGGHTWLNRRYDGNDLELRAELPRGNRVRLLVWVTAPRGANASAARIRLSSLVDLLANADDIFDMSLAGVLAELVPSENWPLDALARHEDVFAANLTRLIAGHAELRRHLPHGAVLDAHAVRALALHVQQPDVRIGELLFGRDTPEQVLRRYVRLAWSVEWGQEGHELLREHARLSPQIALGNIATWFEPSLEALAVYLYVRRLLGRARIPNIANQVRGLGILSFDPEPLEPWIGAALAAWEREPAWRREIVTNAESSLTESDLRKIADLLPTQRPADLWPVVRNAETAAIIYELTRRLLTSVRGAELNDALLAWPAHRPSGLDALPDSRHRAAAVALAAFLDEAASVVATLASRTPPPSGLAAVLDWYVTGRYYDLEFGCAAAGDHLRRIPDHDLGRILQSYMDGLRSRVRAFLAESDQQLAEQINASWGKYLNDPRLSIHVLWDLVRKRRLQPKVDARVWIVVFDGMRWDTWQRVVKPRMLKLFEMKTPEKAYLSLLPSWTPIARTGLLSGRPPAEWQGYNSRPTRDQAQLAARFFEIPAGERDARLQFYSGMESDRTYRQLDHDHRYPWNVLIFNISDDGLHQERGDLTVLNAKISTQLDNTMQTLSDLVGPDDTVVVSSDHGFVELDNDDNGVTIQDEDRLRRQAAAEPDPVRYRYIDGFSHEAGMTVRYGDAVYTVAVGACWFRRADGRNRAPDRYAHGGLSLAEMVVPGALLRRIGESRVELAMLAPSREAVNVKEDEALPLDIVIENRGNKQAEFLLEIQADTDGQAQTFCSKVDPVDRWTTRATVRPVYRAGGASTAQVKITLSYTDANGRRVVRHHDVPVKIEARRDRVELQFGGLDELDDLVNI